MGFLLDDDSCSSATMTDMSCSNMSVSLRHSSVFGSTRRGAPAATPTPNGSKSKFKLGWDDSGLSVTRKNKKVGGNSNAAAGPRGFKFSWEDSCVSSVATIDWNADTDSDDDDSDLDGSSTSHFLDNYSYNNNRRKSSTVASSSLGKVLQQVDGIKQFKDDKKEAKKENKNSGLLGGRFEEDDSEEEDLFLPATTTSTKPAPVATKKEEEPVEAVPEEVVEEREMTIKFVESLVTSQVDFVQEEDAVLAIWDDDHVAEDHNQIPWDEEDYEELPWHLQPDLDEDDDLTKRVKVVLGYSSEEEDDEPQTEEDIQDKWRYGDQDDTPALDVKDQCRVDRVEALVIRFVLTLKHKRHCRLMGL